MSVKVHEAFSLDSFQDRLLFFDDFHGDQIQDEWFTAGASVVVVDAQTGGIVRLTTGAITTNTAQIEWNDIRSLLVTKKLTHEIRLKLTQTALTQAFISLRFDAANRIYFRYDANVLGANWYIYCVDGGTTSQNTGVAADTDYHIFRIECHTHVSNHVHFYIDGTEVTGSPITTNIPDDAADYLQPYHVIQTQEDAAKSMDIDYVYIRQER